MRADRRGRARRAAFTARQLWRSGAPPTPAALRAVWTLGVDPRPLILPDARLVVSWAPKCACTHVIAWAFDRMGVLEAARTHHEWVHRYRIEVVNPSEEAWRAAAHVSARGGRGHTLLRVTRDPAARLVSIFRHAVRSARLWPQMAPWLSHDIAREGLSLEEFDRFLGAQDLGARSATNEHFSVQSHPVWDMRFDRVVTLNLDTHPLDEGLAAVDADLALGAGRPAPAALRKAASVERYAVEAPYEGGDPLERHRFRHAGAEGFPKAQLMASPLLLDMVRRHYAPDLGRVATGDTDGRLFAAPAHGDGGPRRASGPVPASGP